MPDQVLWRRLTPTDFKAMSGLAAPSGSGGGAMHIALARPTSSFDLAKFLNAPGKNHIEISTQAGPDHPAGVLSFLSNPHRRAGEWIIQDQKTHRHPAWNAAAGFPSKWTEQGVYVLVFRVGNQFHARWAWRKHIKVLSAYLPQGILSKSTGIGPITAEAIEAFQLGSEIAYVAFQTFSDSHKTAFDPAGLADARAHVFRSICVRQGQAKFRKDLLAAYDGKCAITGETFHQVLDAAHIVPYLGPKTNHVTNGLLLRSDIHVLFDLALITVDPATRKVRIAKRLKATSYASLDGKLLRNTVKTSDQASQAALKAHYSSFEG